MTRGGYRLLLAFFGLVLGASALFVASGSAELGTVPTLACEDWWRDPQPTETVRLEGCVVDLDGHAYDLRPDGRGVEVALVKVRPPGWTPDDEDEPAGLLWVTDDPDVLTLIDRARRAPDQDAYIRMIERYDAEVLRVRPIVGWIARSPPARSDLHGFLIANGTATPSAWMIDSTPRRPMLRAAGLVLFPLGLFGLALLVWLQRRWDRRRLALTGKRAPVRF